MSEIVLTLCGTAGVICLMAVVTWWIDRPTRSMRRDLQRRERHFAIQRLERELFPEWFRPEPTPEDRRLAREFLRCKHLEDWRR